MADDPKPEVKPERWSAQWVSRRAVMEATFMPRIVTAILLPIAAGLYSVWVGLLLVPPCGYLAWVQVQSWREALRRER